MQVTFLGTGTGAVVPDRGCAGIYVRAGKEHLLLDAGPGTLRQLVTLGVLWSEIDRIFLTHYHPDHCLDLVSILFAMRIPDTPRRRPLTIYGPKGLTQLYRRLNTAFRGWIAPRGYRLTLAELGRSTVRGRGFTVRSVPMRHSTQAIGFRLEAEGQTVSYSGDTDVCPEVVELGRKADVLILECSVTDERKVAGHLTPTECGALAARAGCRQLVLTHFYPVFQGYDIRARVRRAFRGRLTLARDVLTIAV